MKVVKIAIAVAAVLLGGCTVVPYKTTYQTCQLLDTAIKESNELSPGWYIEAGSILEKCGDPTGPARAEFTACFADKSKPAQRCLDQFGEPEPLKN